MADLFTDSDDEKSVEQILSQSMESIVLEQVAAINCAGFTDSGLPSHLETRFRKLKSFPSSKAKHASLSTQSSNLSHSSIFKKSETVSEAKTSVSSGDKNGEKSEKELSTCFTKSPEAKSCLSDSGSLSPFRKTPQAKMEKKKKKETKSPLFSSCDGFSSRSDSPPAKSGCFLCSPKKVSKKKNNRGLDLGLHWGNDDELLSDLSNFSANNQKKMIKKALEKEERICREAEKIVKWAKHASARMDVSGIEDELSDNENAKFP